MSKINLLNYTLMELEDVLTELGEKKFRALQIFEWLHQKQVTSFDEMSNLSKPLREKLKSQTQIPQIEVVRTQTDHQDGTQKMLYRFGDGEYAETVKMVYEHGSSVCISSQIGCRMGCTFCASTLGGLNRNLSAAEMLMQIYEIERNSGPVHSVVIMGMGEPFDNYSEFLRFVELINHPHGRNLGSRHITVSTCGLADKIKEFADLKTQINLAVSLHQARQEKRAEIMPIARKYDLETLKSACQYYISKTNRRITFEYGLIENKTDQMVDADALIGFCKGLLCHINLIPINPVADRNQKAPDKKRQYAFKNYLEKAGIPVSLRRTLGKNIDAACGQLRKKEEEICKQ
ncbi:23S rRNA (adenine(2503)-C(2))-methyltransferase RlmN [Clostridiales bacterium COT073_COT-073]|nr:23S rRNA (adenine(2503)-C(2))-methyltransferase RlmN [Clostridiales bacterium COT073_COT-073]